jgi:hypothetical protein
MKKAILLCVASFSLFLTESASAITTQQLLSACRPVASAEVLVEGVRFHSETRGERYQERQAAASASESTGACCTA